MESQSLRELTNRHTMVLVRWVLIIATSYLVLFSRPAGAVSLTAALFIAAYLASNVVLSGFLPHLHSRRRYDLGIVAFDTVTVSIAILLTSNSGSDFFPVYFFVVFLSALTQRLALLVGAAVLISVVHLSTLSQFISLRELLDNGYMLRVPFLLAVALFLGYQVEGAYRRERAAAAALRKRQRIDFLSAVTHDLKNPLGVIQSLAELLLDGSAGAPTTQQASLIRRIHASAVHVLQLAVNSLDATRIRSGPLTLLRSPTSLAEIVERVILRTRSAADLKGITLECAADPPAPLVAMDALQMERVVANLLDNAIKYTPPGGTVRATLTPEAGQLVLDIRDNGPGIPPAELPSIFGKYQRRAASVGVEGSGLGLFIVKAIVGAHGGTVEAHSVVGAGTTVTVRLPTAQAERPAAATDLAPPATRCAWGLSST